MAALNRAAAMSLFLFRFTVLILKESYIIGLAIILFYTLLEYFRGYLRIAVVGFVHCTIMLGLISFNDELVEVADQD